jgi:hemerythrin
MELIAWLAEYDTGYAPIDDDHRALAAELNHLHRLHQGAFERTQVAALLAALAEHVALHFAYEETVMEKLGFSGLGKHRLEHDNLRADLAEVMAEYGRGAYDGVEGALENYLKFWLLTHITTEDFKLADLLAAGAFPHSE